MWWTVVLLKPVLLAAFAAVYWVAILLPVRALQRRRPGHWLWRERGRGAGTGDHGPAPGQGQHRRQFPLLGRR